MGKIILSNESVVDMLDDSTYNVTITLVDATFSEIQMLETEEYNQISKSILLATQIIAQGFSDEEAIIVKDIYPHGVQGRHTARVIK